MEELAKYFEDLDEARRIRQERADWSYIQSRPPRQRAALQYYIETGDLYVAHRRHVYGGVQRIEEKGQDPKHVTQAVADTCFLLDWVNFSRRDLRATL